MKYGPAPCGRFLGTPGYYDPLRLPLDTQATSRVRGLQARIASLARTIGVKTALPGHRENRGGMPQLTRAAHHQASAGLFGAVGCSSSGGSCAHITSRDEQKRASPGTSVWGP
jgi:hypothetical protein